MNKKLYVGNLSYELTEDDLKKLFGEIGPVVSATIITDKDSGRSKGFGFVEMGTEQAAQKAIDQLNNHQINQRSITVSEARPPKERSFGGGDRRGGGERWGGGDRRDSGGDRRGGNDRRGGGSSGGGRGKQPPRGGDRRY